MARGKKAQAAAPAQAENITEIFDGVEAGDLAYLDQVALRTLRGDLRDVMLKALKNELRNKAWKDLDETKQAAVAKELDGVATQLVLKATKLLRTLDVPSMPAEFSSYTATAEKITLKLVVPHGVENLVQCAGLVGQRVMLLSAAAHDAMAERAPVRIDPDAPKLPLGGEGAGAGATVTDADKGMAIEGSVEAGPDIDHINETFQREDAAAGALDGIGVSDTAADTNGTAETVEEDDDNPYADALADDVIGEGDGEDGPQPGNEAEEDGELQPGEELPGYPPGRRVPGAVALPPSTAKTGGRRGKGRGAASFGTH